MTYKEEQLQTTNLVSCLVIRWDIMWSISSEGSRNEMVDNEVVISRGTEPDSVYSRLWKREYRVLKVKNIIKIKAQLKCVLKNNM